MFYMAFVRNASTKSYTRLQQKERPTGAAESFRHLRRKAKSGSEESINLVWFNSIKTCDLRLVLVNTVECLKLAINGVSCFAGCNNAGAWIMVNC